MIDKTIIKEALLDIKKQCLECDLCWECPVSILCTSQHMPLLWNDEDIENMAAVYYELLNKEE